MKKYILLLAMCSASAVFDKTADTPVKEVETTTTSVLPSPVKAVETTTTSVLILNREIKEWQTAGLRWMNFLENAYKTSYEKAMAQAATNATPEELEELRKYREKVKGTRPNKHTKETVKKLYELFMTGCNSTEVRDKVIWLITTSTEQSRAAEIARAAVEKLRVTDHATSAFFVLLQIAIIFQMQAFEPTATMFEEMMKKEREAQRTK